MWEREIEIDDGDIQSVNRFVGYSVDFIGNVTCVDFWLTLLRDYPEEHTHEVHEDDSATQNFMNLFVSLGVKQKWCKLFRWYTWEGIYANMNKYDTGWSNNHNEERHTEEERKKERCTINDDD